MQWNFSGVSSISASFRDYNEEFWGKGFVWILLKKKNFEREGRPMNEH
jgi:hypothetical protein